MDLNKDLKLIKSETFVLATYQDLTAKETMKEFATYKRFFLL